MTSPGAESFVYLMSLSFLATSEIGAYLLIHSFFFFCIRIHGLIYH